MSNELKIAYDDTDRLGVLAFSGPNRVWAAIRRVCEDVSEQTQKTGPQSLTIPWWAFLGCRPEIIYLSNRFSFAVTPEGVAIEKIAQADETSEAYAAALASVPADRSKIEAELRAANFERAKNNQLTNEQSRNIARLVSFPSGATFSVPGAGKTTEALATYTLKRKANSRLVVVCPKNAFSAWEEQLAICLPQDAQFVRLRGGKKAISAALKLHPDKVLITYQQLPGVSDQIASYLEGAHSFMFLDESHKIKRGFVGVIGNSILSLSEVPDIKLIMSGTPMPNDISDLVPQFRFLFPEIQADKSTVENLIRPIYVRTTKLELNIPPIEKKAIRIPLRPAQYELYELLRSETARQLKTHITPRDRMSLRRAGQSALRMLQITTNPALLARIQFEHPDLLSAALEEGDSPKMEYACFRARQLASEGSKSIIWSSFVANVELIANRLIDVGAEFIHGGVDAGDDDEEGTREQKIKRFHEDDTCMVLVANPAACGEGISLHTVCHHAIYLDRNYNAAQYLQSEDRIHRLGLKPNETTFVEILVAPDTVDESVDRRLSAKIQNMARVLDDAALHVEPETVDLDADGFTFDDYKDLKDHYERRL